MQITATGDVLGATVTDVDLNRPLSPDDFRDIVVAMGEHGVLRFPNQLLAAPELKAFSERFGYLQIIPKHVVPYVEGTPEVSILSNGTAEGESGGVPNPGQVWHTDASYNDVVGYANVLVAYAVPHRDGKPLGGTEFINTQAAYEDLPDDIKRRLENATAMHVYGKQIELESALKGNPIKLSSADRAARPPVHHPVFLTHPITGRKAIYVNPGHVERIDGVSDAESEALLDMLFEHVLRPKYYYRHDWKVGDLTIWDNLRTWHKASADYGPGEYRHMKRCQIMADRVFSDDFLEMPVAA